MISQMEGNSTAGCNFPAPQPALVLSFSSSHEVLSSSNGFPEGRQDLLLLKSSIQKVGEEFCHPGFDVLFPGAQSENPQYVAMD